MPDRPEHRRLSRREIMTTLGAAGAVLVPLAAGPFARDALAQSSPASPDGRFSRSLTVGNLRGRADVRDGDWVVTAGFNTTGDGGGALYRIVKSTDLQPNDADVLALRNGHVAELVEAQAVNYRMFGAVGDGEQDDGVRIKLAHEYANTHQVPVVNRSGEFWIKQTNDIPITTNVHWGKTVFHIDERYNARRGKPRFVIRNDRPTEDIPLDAELKAALLEKIRPGVQIIPELAPWAGHLVIVADAGDRIGIRAGNYSKRGWAREELFYVEEEGRILGDIAWSFKNFTSVTAVPCNDNVLTVEGGGFYCSGHQPESGRPGYHKLGFSLERSRTIIRDQWVGLEPGRSDDSLEPRSGFYNISRVYNLTLENIRAMPWEKNRPGDDRDVKHGTYGISGSRMLNCTFRNLTADAGWVSWGFFGTNLNKNFRVENCRLNRIDVHFHCWNLYIRDCVIGFKGISITGGGDLVIEDTVLHGRSFVSFRSDYGSRWDGHIRLRGCTLRPTGDGVVAVLSYRPRKFDYQYPVGFARSIHIEDMVIDYAAAPGSDAACWLMRVVPFSRSDEGGRLFFPREIIFRNIMVEGREQGVRLLHVPDPGGYDIRREGGYDGSALTPNCSLVCQNVQLENLVPRHSGDTGRVHLLLGTGDAVDYLDARALYPQIRFTDCHDVVVHLGGAVASVFFERCTVNTVAAPGLRGELVFNDCRFRPRVASSKGVFYPVDSTLGTRFTNCTVHAPVVNGQLVPGAVDRSGFLVINGAVKHHHINTTLANDVLAHLRRQSIALTPEFVTRLRAHHALEE